MTGQLPLAIAELLIRCTPAIGATSHDDATAVTPVLYPHTNASLAFGNQQDPILILGHIARGAACAFPVSVFLFPPRARWRSSARAPRREAPRAFVPGLQVGFQGVRSRSCVRAREGGGGRATRRSRSRCQTRRCRIDLGEARLTGRGLIPYAHHGEHAG